MVIESLIEGAEAAQYADLPDELLLEMKELADRIEAFRQNPKQALNAKPMEVENEEEKPKKKRDKEGASAHCVWIAGNKKCEADFLTATLEYYDTEAPPG